MKTLTKVASFGLIALSLYAQGCAASSDETVAEDNAAVTGSMRREQAVKIRDAYVAADISALTPLDPSLETVPAKVRANIENRIAINPTFRYEVESAASFTTPVGKIFIVETSKSHESWQGYQREVDFYDEFGTWLVYGIDYFPWDGTPSTGMRFFWMSETPGTDQQLL